MVSPFWSIRSQLRTLTAAACFFLFFAAPPALALLPFTASCTPGGARPTPSTATRLLSASCSGANMIVVCYICRCLQEAACGCRCGCWAQWYRCCCVLWPALAPLQLSGLQERLLTPVDEGQAVVEAATWHCQLHCSNISRCRSCSGLCLLSSPRRSWTQQKQMRCLQRIQQRGLCSSEGETARAQALGASSK